MPTFNEPVRPLEFLLSDANGQISMESGVIESGAGVLPAGAVLGRVTANSKFRRYNAANTPAGTGTAVAILAYPVDASAADVTAAIVARHAEVKSAALSWGAENAGSITTGTGQLANVQILVR